MPVHLFRTWQLITDANELKNLLSLMKKTKTNKQHIWNKNK